MIHHLPKRFLRLALFLTLALTIFPTVAADWPTYLHDTQRTSASANEMILSPTTAGQLRAVWSFKTGGAIATSATVADGTVFIGSWDGYEYALDEATGALKWKRYLGQAITPPCASLGVLGITSAATVQNGVVYVGGGGAYWYALDAASGAVLWRVSTGSTSTTGGHYNWSSPLIYHGNAYIGIASFCDAPLVQGQLLQVDLTTHQIMHTFKVVPDGQTGGGIWTSPSVDAATNTIYVTTGNEGQEPVTSQPYARAIVALNATTLAVQGAWQVPDAQAPPGVDDWDWTTTPAIFSDAAGVPLVAAMNKNGYIYTFNRTNLAVGPLWSQQLATVVGPYADISTSSAAFGNGTLYQAAAGTTLNTVPYSGSVRALDPAMGSVLWEHGAPGNVIGALAYANGLVVVGASYSRTSTLEVLNAQNGAVLYSRPATSTIPGAPIVADGRIFYGYLDGTVYALGVSALSANRTNVGAQTTMVISGTTFGSNEQVGLYWDSTSTSPVVSTTAAADGSFAATLRVPQTPFGGHTIIAVGRTSGTEAVIAVHVKPVAVPNRYYGPPGAHYQLSGVGFGANETVQAHWEPGNQPLGAPSTTNASGTFAGTAAISFTVPLSSTGVYYIVTVGQSSNALAATPFSVTTSLTVAQGKGGAHSTNSSAPYAVVR